MTLSFGVAQCKNYLQNPQQQFPSFTNSSALRAIRFSKKRIPRDMGHFGARQIMDRLKLNY